MKRMMLFITLLVFLCGCITIEIPTKEPLTTPTPISIYDIDLYDFLITNDDLGPDAIATKTKKDFIFQYIEAPLDMIYQQWEDDENIRGGISIYLYESPLDVKNTFNHMVASEPNYEGTTSTEVEVGEKAYVITYPANDTTTVDLIFYRCFFQVNLHYLSGSIDEVVRLGKIVDQKIIDKMCH
jgi:hypothetical protein